jgi:hypothetical protein
MLALRFRMMPADADMLLCVCLFLLYEFHTPTLCFECNIRKKRATKPVRACEPAREPDQVPVQRPEPAGEPDQVPVQFYLHFFAVSRSRAVLLEPAPEPDQAPGSRSEPAGEPDQDPVHFFCTFT